MAKLLLTSLLAAMALAASQPNWERDGRPLPRPERQSAPLDPALPPYQACAQNVSAQATGSVTAILPDLFARWTLKLKLLQPGIRMVAAPPYGPPQGKLSTRLTEFLEGRSDFALVSRRLSEADLATHRRATGTDPLVVPVAAGSWRHFGFVDTVVVIVNLANPIRRLTFAQLAAVFSDEVTSDGGALRDWSQLGSPSWRGRPIRVVGGATWLAEDSARSAVFRERVLQGGKWRADLDRSGSEADAPGRVAQDPNAIAVTGLGHLPHGVRVLALSESPARPYVAPDYRSVTQGNYPLSRTIDLLLRRRADHTINPATAEFLRFALSREGQAEVVRQGIFLPLRAKQSARSRALLGKCQPRTSPTR